jgi:cytoskeletal protein RodZ
MTNNIDRLEAQIAESEKKELQQNKSNLMSISLLLGFVCIGLLVLLILLSLKNKELAAQIPTITPTPTITRTPRPTQTNTPTQTPTEIPTETPLPTETPTETLTGSATNTKPEPLTGTPGLPTISPEPIIDVTPNTP